MSELLSLHGLSRRLDVAPLTLRKRVEAGHISPVSVTAGRPLFDASKLDEYRALFTRPNREAVIL
jgi:hypothetical protein